MKKDLYEAMRAIIPSDAWRSKISEEAVEKLMQKLGINSDTVVVKFYDSEIPTNTQYAGVNQPVKSKELILSNGIHIYATQEVESGCGFQPVRQSWRIDVNNKIYEDLVFTSDEWIPARYTSYPFSLVY